MRGVTPQLLFGNDLNHNGTIDPEEGAEGGPVDQGWSAYLTVYSRERNIDSDGNPYLLAGTTPGPITRTMFDFVMSVSVPSTLARPVIGNE